MTMTKVVDGRRVEVPQEEEQAIRAEWDTNEQKSKEERQDQEEREHLSKLRVSILDQIAIGETPNPQDQAELKALLQKHR